ncbi:hypothetical protein ACPPVO_21645 [Dactylosporangium sp. McL0621]|uniref:hypothetical protein n=1 Tax=Dactylosporangium sp. McL0621 TaxID=3415678 RepID=UPI003CF02D48
MAEGMKVLRTPPKRFADLPEYPFAQHYVEIDAGDGAGTQQAAHDLADLMTPTATLVQVTTARHLNPK